MRTAFQALDISDKVEMISRAMVSFETVTPEGEVLESVVAPYFDGSGWRSDYLFYQPEFEDVIAARGRELGVSVFMGATVTELRQQGSSVELPVHQSDDPGGEPSFIEASSVVGADGAKSFVRQAIGAVKQDLGFAKIDNLVVDFIHNDPDREIPQMAENRSIVDPKRPTLTGRWAGGEMSRFEFRVFENEDRDFIESDEKVWSLIAPYGVGQVLTISAYYFQMFSMEPVLSRILLSEVLQQAPGRHLERHLNIRAKVIDTFEELAKAAQHSGELRRDLDPRMIALCIQFAFTGASRWWIVEPSPAWRSGQRYFEQIIKLLAEGINAQPAKTAAVTTARSARRPLIKK